MFCVCLVLAQACRYQSEQVPDLTFTHEIFPQPPRVGPTTITLRLADASGKPVIGADVEMEGNMSHAGMTPVLAHANETEPGRYSSTIELSMAGDWYFVVHITLADGRKLEHEFEIKGVTQRQTGSAISAYLCDLCVNCSREKYI